MSYSDTLGKRQQSSSKGKMNTGGDQFTKKRDAKESAAGDDSSRTRETDTGNGGIPKDNQFSSFPEITPKTVQVLKAKGYRDLFPIQKECFYPMFQRHDLIARDLTGSGKTIAFGLPLIEFLRKNKHLKTGKLQAICLAPTRELALQITGELSKLKHSVEEFRIVTVYGGVSVINQANALKSGADIFVGTTGRVLDHMERGNIDFQDVKTVILDEADVMLKLGFKDDVEKILGQCKQECDKNLQLALFSATIPDWVKDLAQEHMRQDFRVIDLAQDLTRRTAKHINHLAIDCPFPERMDALAKVLSCYGGTGRILVFTSTKADANSLLLSDKITHDVEAMHGDIAQNQREVTMRRFREGKFQVLVATDVASRGLDIPEIDLVIQLDPPKDTESYIHRSGRTARAGRAGTCITFYNNRSEEFVDRIEELAGVKLERVGIPSEEDMVKAQTKGILKRLLDVEMEVLPMFEDTADLLINQHHGDASKALQIALAYCSGHYKQAAPTESLLNGQKNLLTLKMSAAEGGKLGAQAAFAIIYKYWAPRIQESIRIIRPFQDGSGAVFDIRAQWVDAFLDNFEHLKNGDKQVDFEVCIAKSLPPCGPDEEKREREPREDDGNGSGRRGGGGGGYDDQNGDDRRGGGGGRSYGDRGDRDRDQGGGSRRDRGDDRRGAGGGGGGNSGGGGGGWSGGGGGSGGGSGWNIDGNYKKPEFDNDYRKPSDQTPPYGGSTYGGSTSYSQNKYSAPTTPNYEGQRKAPPRYNDFGDRKMQDPKPSSSSDGPVIYLTNLNFQVNEQRIMTYLKEYDLNPVRAKLLYDSEGKSKGTGFVQMSSPSEAQDAIEKLSNQVFEGRKLIINIANQQVRQTC